MQNEFCQTCSKPLQGQYCHHCGQKYYSSRWSVQKIAQHIVHIITDVEKGFWHTIHILVVNPGKVMNDYWRGSTIPYYPPFRYALIWLAISLLINFSFGLDEMLREQMDPILAQQGLVLPEAQAEQRANAQFNQFLNILVFLLIPFSSFLTYLFFRKKEKNYAEHLIMNTYILGQQSVFSSLTQFLFIAVPSLIIYFHPINLFVVGIGYNTYVYRSTFKVSLGNALWKASIVAILSLLLLFLLIGVLSWFITVLLGVS